MRGLLAEFIVACDLGIADGVRLEWEPYDLVTNNGIKVEVKSASYVQNWAQKRHSNIIFGIQPTIAWDSKTNTYDDEKRRQADFYVFCVLNHKDRASIDPLNVDQWEFYILPASRLDRTVGNQKTIAFSRLVKIGPHKASYGEIRETIERLASEDLN
jgi:hypothetical protein